MSSVHERVENYSHSLQKKNKGGGTMERRRKVNHFCLLVSSGEDDSSSDEDEDQALLPHVVPIHKPRLRISSADAVWAIQKCIRAYFARKREERTATEVALAARLQMGEDGLSSSPAQKSPEDVDCPTNTMLVEEGDEPPQFAASKAYLFNTQFSQVRFFGRCFLCGCPGHSQRYCALKYCAHCDEYGHSIVCCGRQNFQIQIQRKKSFQRFSSRF